jgi:hypothetical protein
MLAHSECQKPAAGIHDRSRSARTMTAELMSDVIGETGRRLASMRQTEATARIGLLIQSEAWTDAALALVELELPQWRLRRIAYDEGEWHCALSRQRELPEWLDQAVEARHANLPLAILGAFMDAKALAASASRTSVPAAPRDIDALYAPVLSENFA